MKTKRLRFRSSMTTADLCFYLREMGNGHPVVVLCDRRAYVLRKVHRAVIAEPGTKQRRTIVAIEAEQMPGLLERSES